MARTGDPDSATAQFFINVVDNDRLDKPISGGAAYCVFGKVVEGMDVVDKIRDTEVITHDKYPSGGQPVVPATPVVINDVTVVKDCDRSALAEAKAKQEKKLKGPSADEHVKALEAKLGQSVQKSESGLMWFVLQPGDGRSAAHQHGEGALHRLAAGRHGVRQLCRAARRRRFRSIA